MQEQKFVIVVRKVSPQNFSGRVSLATLRRSDEWRVTRAATPGEAVQNVLGHGEVPLLWFEWKELPVAKRMWLRIREMLGV